MSSPVARAEAPARPYHVDARLIAEMTAIVPGTDLTLGIRQVIEPGWHTYWRNPGDSGEPLHLTWQLPAGFSAGEIAWPAPKRQPVGPLVNFGYDGRVMPLVTLHVPKDLKPGTRVSLTADASWLVCADICVPEDKRLVLTLPVQAGPAAPDPLWVSDFLLARAALPQPFTGKVRFARDHDRLRLTLAGGNLPSAIASAAFFPLVPRLIRNAAPQDVAATSGALVIAVAAGRSFTEAGLSPPAEIEGVVTLEDDTGAHRAFAVSAGAPGPAAMTGRPSLSVPVVLLFAFLGGLILNLMPCVLPVLTMKAVMIMTQAHQNVREARAQGLAYGAGVVASMLGIASLLLLARAGGAEIGWGFQFQSPFAVALMALFFYGIALNFLGLFEVAFLQGLGTAQSMHGLGGAFLTGVLAVAAASPCTAPFMAAALGAALGASATVALAIFAGLGAGMAAPFVLLSTAPGLLKRMPRPGPWMIRLKHWLAVPMIATALWLGWVLVKEAGFSALGLLGLSAAGLTLVLFAVGRAQHGDLRRMRRAGLGAAVVGLVAAATLVVRPPTTSSEMASEAYSPAHLAALRAAGKPVFVDLTAAWCITCKVNETLVLSSPRIEEAFRRRGVSYLRGDWTRRDPKITELLADYGRNGVPLYLYFAPGAERGTLLPQILTEDAVLSAISVPAT